MMNRCLAALALCSSLLPASSAWAQWQFALGTGLRQAHMTETSPSGQALVREYGLLPGLSGTASYPIQDWLLTGRIEAFARTLTYDGHLQSGASFSSTTHTVQQRYNIDLAYGASASTSLVGGLELDRWARQIRGRDAVLGLNEHYTSWRLLVGAQTQLLRHPQASLDGSIVLVVARPERLHVRFEQQVYDDASFTTGPARGLRLALALRPASCANLTITTELDTLTVRRSDDVTLRKDGLAVGSVAQPRHRRQALELRASYSF